MLVTTEQAARATALAPVSDVTTPNLNIRNTKPEEALQATASGCAITATLKLNPSVFPTQNAQTSFQPTQYTLTSTLPVAATSATLGTSTLTLLQIQPHAPSVRKAHTRAKEPQCVLNARWVLTPLHMPLKAAQTA